MFKKIFTKLLAKDHARPAASDGFFLDVRCSECDDKFHLFIHKSLELSQNFEEDGRVTYFLKKTIFAVGCPNRIHVDMKFDSSKNLVSRHIENGEFIDA